ncbi:MAG: T9SS type A sorting domain-containing protein [Bacteroidetes bacterium]|nr:T9SS type A sorting domain-containing protein [Bacteroidota bacterium]
MKKNILILAFAFSGLIANAQTYLMENFSYGSSADSLTNPTNGGINWIRHSGTGTPLSYLSTGLVFSGYNSSAIGGAVGFAHGAGSREDANRRIPFSMTSGSIYAAFLINISAGGGTGTTSDYFFHLCDTFGATGISNLRGRLFVRTGTGANTFNLGLTKGSAATAAVFSGDYPLNTTHLVVVKYVYIPGTANDSVYAFVIPNGSSIPATEPAATLAATDVTTISDFTRVQSVCIRQGSTGTGAGTIDGIRVAQSWSDGPLPVSMKGFSGSFEEGSVLLNWATASETNNSGFSIERSADGIEFESIGFVKGQGNSNRSVAYSFEDRNPLAVNYYRLAQTDFDGTIHYSEVIKVAEAGVEIEISPNPFENEVLVTVGSEIPVSAEIFDIQGKSKAVATGMGAVSLDTKALESGIYFVRVNTGNETRVQRIVRN